jgi:predicted CxxxxCH...CXXCH cytochrome family protein
MLLRSTHPSVAALRWAALSLACAAACGGDDSAVDGAADVPGDVPADDGAGESLDDGGTDDAPAACDSCHGAGGNPNPPPGLDGAFERSARGVGAHAVHLAESTWHLGVRCQHCHVVPATVDAAGHIDDARPADVTFSGLATSRMDASWDGTSCNVYCHGGAMRIAPRISGPWTGAGGTTCTSCHDQPPGAPHPPATDCSRCHLDVAAADGSIGRPLLHIDSVVAAPHGAHLVHLGGNGGTDFPCTTCHPDGRAYHGPLRDGGTLDSTTVCDPCHAAGTVDAAAWRGYDPYTP